MIEVFVRLELDGADNVPMLTIAQEIESVIAGDSFKCKDEEGATANVVIDSATVGDFSSFVAEET